ncbi:MAG TPA: GGDEF domain-containing protein [Longimicrobiales bacterium]|nr:GGDEF domain-containing protein [Longimicrobiales bacterium]
MLHLILVASAILSFQQTPAPGTPAQAAAQRCWDAIIHARDSVTSYAQQGLKLARDERSTMGLELCRAWGLEDGGKVLEAIAIYELGVREALRLRDNDLYARALVLRGEARYVRGEINTSLNDLNTAYAIFGKLGNKDSQKFALEGIANVYADARVGQYDRAIEYYRQILKIDQAREDMAAVAEGYFNIAGTLEQQKKLKEALVEYRRGLKIDEERNDADEVAYDRRAIGIVLYKLKRPAESLALIEQSLAHYQKTGNVEMVAWNRLNRAVALRMLGRIQDAIADLEFTRRHFVATKNDRFLHMVEQESALSYAAAGDWQRAYRAKAAQYDLQKSLSGLAGHEQTTRLRIEFDAEKKEQENRALQRENANSAEIRRLQFTVLILGAIIIAFLAAFAYRQIRNARRLRITALTDDLTGLPNRRHLMLLANEGLKACRNAGQSFAVLALDIDFFKRINDTFGHAAGDAVLQRVSRTLQSTLRGGDHVGRVGGEEFVAILPRAAQKDAEYVAARVRENIENTDYSDIARDLEVTVSIGVAVAQSNDEDFTDIHQRADHSLYAAKAGGRNRIEVAATSMMLAVLMMLSACKTVVTTTTEIRPARYAVLEFTRPVSHDNIVKFAQQAVRAENLKVQSVDADKAIVMAGPLKMAATGGQPALEALITISAETSGANTRVRIYASSPVEQNQIGGTDARLMDLAQRIEKRLDVLIGH